MLDRTAYPFTDHWAQLSAGRMHYVDEGTGETVLFVHGTPTWSFEWRHVIRALAPAWRCVAPDLIGFGLSDRPKDFPYTPEAHAAAFSEFADRAVAGYFTLVMHDYGGPIALPFAIRHPDRVRRLVVINSWMWSFRGDPEMEKKGRVAGGAMGRFLYRWLNMSLKVLTPYAYGDRRKLTPQIHEQYLERFPDRWSRGAVLWPLARALLGSSEFYDSLWRDRAALRGRPALILWGMRDKALTPRLLSRWREALPDATVVQLAASGHWPHEEEPDRVVSELLSFLRAQ